jgi:hypothetical protein
LKRDGRKENEKIVSEIVKRGFEKKFFLPLIHHSFEVECCCSQHDIDVIAKYSFEFYDLIQK